MIEKGCGREVLCEPMQYCSEFVHILILIDTVQRLVDRTVSSQLSDFIMNWKFKHPHFHRNGWIRTVHCRTGQMIKG